MDPVRDRCGDLPGRSEANRAPGGGASEPEALDAYIDLNQDAAPAIVLEGWQDPAALRQLAAAALAAAELLEAHR
ncbi:hypothetical protein D0Z08_27340 [Nocardioides immobilis]|uniref:Uncharacterized protein n=1 Tax=Nocardioides immobilis TaxID=2049295 RepID=A0A417XTJ0_9ACTN|nr:hypothetical protein [Nocardioides immobilis]RHW23814.1 hypothetical protein D0Z08_27340 [Nocardioides immobilis]